MTLSLTAGRADLVSLDVPLLVVAQAPGAPRDEPLTALDATLGGALGRLLDRRDFRAGRDETLHLAGAISGPARVLLVGLGKGSERASALRRVGALAARFRAHGMALATAAAAVTTLLVALVAAVLVVRADEAASLADIATVSGLYAAMLGASSWLFRRSDLAS